MILRIYCKLYNFGANQHQYVRTSWSFPLIRPVIQPDLAQCSDTWMHKRGEWRLGLHLIQSCGYNKWRDQAQSSNCCKRSSQVKKPTQTSPTKHDLSFIGKGSNMSNLLGKKICRKKTGEGQLKVAERCIPRWYQFHSGEDDIHT